MTRLHRLLHPKTVAVIGGGTWAANVIRECGKIGFEGAVWPVHPSKPEVGGLTAYPSLEALPEPPDAAFVAINRDAAIEAVAVLSGMGAGGAICFASGFAEAEAELGDGAVSEARLVAAAGDMPVLGPNCYGALNYLDGAALWPDQHGGRRVKRGVAIVTQSSNIAINLTMQRRGLPVGFVLTAGNQAQIGAAELGMAALEDERITALGLYLEGVGDLSRLVALAERAAELGKPVVVLKSGATEAAQTAAISHTASLAGAPEAAAALFRRLGWAQVSTLEGFLEALKIAHVVGRLPSRAVASMSCSGGEAALMADLGAAAGLDYPPLTEAQLTGLRDALGPKVALANPLDYHTYIWGDGPAMERAYTAMLAPHLALGLLVLDFPRDDRCTAPGWDAALDAAVAACRAAGVPMAVLASLPDTMPEAVAEDLIARGVVPLSGMEAGLEAVAAMAGRAPAPEPPRLPRPVRDPVLVPEDAAKARLAAYGLDRPRGAVVDRAQAVAEADRIGFPVALKGLGLAHKTEAGAVALNRRDAEAVERALDFLPGDKVLVEEMVAGPVAELLLSVMRDPAHGYLLTLGWGGTATELHADTVHRLLPVSEGDIRAMLDGLRLAPLLKGYRGAPGADIGAIVRAVRAVQDFVEATPGVVEVEINPLICTTDRAVAVDALIREGVADE